MCRFRTEVLLGMLFAIVMSFSLVGCGEGEGEAEGTATASADSTQADSTQADSTKTAEKGDKKGDEKKKAPEGVPVKVALVDRGKISEHVLYSATVEAEETIDIYAQASGLVRRVIAEEGDRVRVGQVMVELVDDELRLNEAEARLAYENMDNQLKRKQMLFDRKLLSREAYEDLKINRDQAEIRWKRAKLSLDHARVRSPVAGIVSKRSVKLGDRIGQSNKLYEVVDMRNLIAQVHVPGQGMRHLNVGQKALVTTDFIPDTAFSGRIIRISPVVDPGSGTFKVTLAIEAKEGGLRPGMFVNTHIVTATHEEAVLVPKRAVVYDDGLPHVFVVQDSTASKIQFQMGFDDTEHVEVLSGVDQGDQIVVVGQNGLKDKAKVRIIPGPGLRIPAKPDSTDAKKEKTS